MQPQTNIDQQSAFEVVIGLFDTQEHASRVAASLRSPDLIVQKISKKARTSPDQLPDIVYEDVDQIEGDHVVNGALLGATIGLTSGLLFLAVPGLNLAAPVAGGLVGAWIGGIAGIDEANRGIELPDPKDYRDMLDAGKSLVVIAGEESLRVDFGVKLTELGAKKVFQHPPIQQLVR